MKPSKRIERRTKIRFAAQRELRYKLLDGDKIVVTGQGETIDMSSGGIAFRSDSGMPNRGNYLELSISWPALLDDSCPMRLIVYGRMARRSGATAACIVEKWEFRTGSRQMKQPGPTRIDSRLSRWMECRREMAMKPILVSAAG